MAISSYLELKTAIQNWAKRGDILSVIDDFIDLAESDMWQKLRIRDMEARATATASDRYLALPDDFQQMRKLRFSSGGVSFALEQLTPESMNVKTGAGKPEAFTVTTQLEFDRTPDASYEMEMQYYKSLTPLSSSNASNGVLDRFPAIYLYGALFHFGQWAHNDSFIMKYSQLFDEEMKRANKNDRRGRHGPVPAMRIEGSTP